MSTALPFVDPEILSVGHVRGLLRRVASMPSLHVGAVLLSVLLGGLLLSIATTRDPLWWHLHFSQLGIFGDFSSALFNTTLKVSGCMVMVFALFVRRDIRRLGRGPVRRGSATLACICLNTVGINLALVGCVPLNTDKDLHDRVAALMVLGFLVLLASAPFMLHRLGMRMAIATGVAIVWLAASITLFVTATINLALFETISCSAMFAWSGMFTHTLGRVAARARSRSDDPVGRTAAAETRRGRFPRRPPAGRTPRRATPPGAGSVALARPTAWRANREGRSTADAPSATRARRAPVTAEAATAGRAPDPVSAASGSRAVQCTPTLRTGLIVAVPRVGAARKPPSARSPRSASPRLRTGEAPPRMITGRRASRRPKIAPRPALIERVASRRATHAPRPGAAGEATSGRPRPSRTAPRQTSPRRPRCTLHPPALSAARGTRDGSPGAAPRPVGPPRRFGVRRGALGVARSLLR